MQAPQMGDYDYGSYAVHRTGVAPFGNGPFYNSLPLWSYNPSMMSSPPSSVIMGSSFAAPRRQAMSEAGTTREVGVQRSATVLTARSMPQESVSNHSAAWYQKTKQALSNIPAMFEARTNKGNNHDLDRYNRWQPQDRDSNSTALFLSLPTKPVSFFQANRSQATVASVPDQSAFSKPHSIDGLNQRHDPSAPVFSAQASSKSETATRFNPSAPAPITPSFSEPATSARFNPPASSPIAPAFSESATSARFNPPASASSAVASSARHNPNPLASASPALASSAAASSARHNQNPPAFISTANRPSADDPSAYGQPANSRVFLKPSSTSNKGINTVQASSNHATTKFMADLPSPVRGNAVTTRPPAESSSLRPPQSGIHSRQTGEHNHPSQNALGHRPFVEVPPHSSFPSSPHEYNSKDYSAEPSGNIKVNPLFESHVKERGGLDLSSAFAMSSGAEIGPNRHLAGQRIPTDGVRDGNRLATKVNAKSTSAVDEKQIIKDAFEFLDDFDE